MRRRRGEAEVGDRGDGQRPEPDTWAGGRVEWRRRRAEAEMDRGGRRRVTRVIVDSYHTSDDIVPVRKELVTVPCVQLLEIFEVYMTRR